MDPLRELGKLLVVVGVVLVGAGALLIFGARLPFRLGRLARRYLLPRPQWQFLFSDRHLHCRERRAYADILDCEFLPALKP